LATPKISAFFPANKGIKLPLVNQIFCMAILDEKPIDTKRKIEQVQN
jgi:hypothetical protein